MLKEIFTFDYNEEKYELETDQIPIKFSSANEYRKIFEVLINIII